MGLKFILGISIMLFIILALSITAYLFIKNMTENIEEKLYLLNNDINNKKWLNASEIFKDITKKWEKAETIFPVLIDHDELHNLEISLAKISVFIKNKNKKELLVEINVALKLISSISEQEKLSLKNIF